MSTQRQAAGAVKAGDKIGGQFATLERAEGVAPPVGVVEARQFDQPFDEEKFDELVERHGLHHGNAEYESDYLVVEAPGHATIHIDSDEIHTEREALETIAEHAEAFSADEEFNQLWSDGFGERNGFTPGSFLECLQDDERYYKSTAEDIRAELSEAGATDEEGTQPDTPETVSGSTAEGIPLSELKAVRKDLSHSLNTAYGLNESEFANLKRVFDADLDRTLDDSDRESLMTLADALENANYHTECAEFLAILERDRLAKDPKAKLKYGFSLAASAHTSAELLARVRAEDYSGFESATHWKSSSSRAPFED